MDSSFRLPTPPPSSSDSEDTEQEYTPQTPYYIVDLQYRNRRDIQYEPICLVKDMIQFGPLFEVPMGITPTAEAMTELFLPDRLLDKWVSCMNAYDASRKEGSGQPKKICGRLDCCIEQEGAVHGNTKNLHCHCSLHFPR